ncbi:MAG TPA: cation:proton antiporter, partial [Candidatus Nanopelagicales bacterium]|nr:cation:proton antiporter [Candidatus Nanopelagicales bacterium]
MHGLLHEPLPRFIVQAVLIITVARIIGLGARRLRQPMVIAEIVAGIALGPSLLGWAMPELAAALFPQSSMPLLGITSQLGLVLFMFLVGLELDLDVVRKSGRRALTISLSSIALPFLLGAVVVGGWLHSSHDCVPIRSAEVVIEDDEVCVPTDAQEVADDS